MRFVVIGLVFGYFAAVAGLWVVLKRTIHDEEPKPKPEIPIRVTPWYLEDQGSAEQKRFLDKIQAGKVRHR